MRLICFWKHNLTQKGGRSLPLFLSRTQVKDKELKAILAHNRDEEKEHAAMLLEWIRRCDPAFDKELKDYLFTDKPIAHE